MTYNSVISDIDNNKLKNLYLFFGQEGLLINDVLLRIRKKVVNPSLESLNYIKLDGSDLNYETLVNACETLPFMDNKKVVVINDVNIFKAKKTEKDNDEDDGSKSELCNYFGQIPETTILILVAGEQVDKRRKVYNSIKKNGDIVEFKQLKNQELIKWISKGFELAGKVISNDDARYFSERVQGNLEDVTNEINKLCSYSGNNKKITQGDIDIVVPKSLEINIFRLVDSIAMKNPSDALLTFNELLLDSEPIPVILTMIIRQYRLLLNTKLLADKGYTGQEIMSKLSLPSFVFMGLVKLTKKYSESQIQERLKKCLEADTAIKTGRMDPRLSIEALIVEFTR